MYRPASVGARWPWQELHPQVTNSAPPRRRVMLILQRAAELWPGTAAGSITTTSPIIFACSVPQYWAQKM